MLQNSSKTDITLRITDNQLNKVSSTSPQRVFLQSVCSIFFTQRWTANLPALYVRQNRLKYASLECLYFTIYEEDFIKQQTGLEETIIKEIEQNQLTWYGRVQRMAEGRLPKIALNWMPKQKRAWGRLKKNWMEGIKKAVNERNLNEGQWEDSKQWSLGVGQCRKTFWNLYIYIYMKRIFELNF